MVVCPEGFYGSANLVCIACETTLGSDCIKCDNAETCKKCDNGIIVDGKCLS